MKRRPLSQALSFAALLLGACACLTSEIRLLAQKDFRANSRKISFSAIQIEPVESDDAALPAEFRVAIYENLVEEVENTSGFQHIYRSGERSAAGTPDLLTLHTRVVGFKEGSQRRREVTTLSGWTTIKTNAQLVTRDGRTVVDREVEGRVRFFGENLNATRSLAKKIAEMIRVTP